MTETCGHQGSVLACDLLTLSAWTLDLLVCVLSHVPLFATVWTVACQSPLPTGFPRQKYWRGLSFLPRGDLPDPGVEPASTRFA